MTTAQIEALGELIEAGQFEAAKSLSEANGYLFIKERDDCPFSAIHVVHSRDGHRNYQSALNHLLFMLRGSKRGNQ